MAEAQVEICLLWGDWQIQQWWSCMSKSEWAAWAQAFGVLGALLMPLIASCWKKRISKKISKEILFQINKNLIFIDFAIQKLKEENYINNPKEKSGYLSSSWSSIIRMSPAQGEHLSRTSHSIHTELLNYENSLFDLIDDFNQECKNPVWNLNNDFQNICNNYSYDFSRKKSQLISITFKLKSLLKDKNRK